MSNVAKGWSPRDNGGYILVHATIGVIEIHHTMVDGRVVDINGKRAWSAWRESFEMMTYSINDKLHTWDYLNTFKRETVNV